MGFFKKLGRVAAGFGTAGLSEVYLAGQRAKQREAQAKENIARQQLSQAEQERAFSLERAAPSAGELARIQRQNLLEEQLLGQQNREIEFLQKGLDLKQPGASEAGRGLFSNILLKQRQAQRSVLESTLRSRFGGGGATSSAGMAALAQFDQQTADMATQLIPQVLQQSMMAAQFGQSLEDTIAKRQIAASQGSSTIPYQGASEIYNLGMARNLQGTVGDIFKTAGTIGGAVLGGMAGGPQGAFAGGSLGGRLGGSFGGGPEETPYTGGTFTYSPFQRFSDFISPPIAGGQASMGGRLGGGSTMMAGGF